MTEAHRRKKQPQVLRQQLLAAAARIAVTEGAAAVTLDAVAKRAGVSKGGLQHHFSSKQALIDALFENMRETFAADLAAEIAADPRAQGRSARAYLKVSTRGFAGAEADAWRAVVTLMLADPALRERWGAWDREFWKDDLAAGVATPSLLICRLAADGLWLSDLAGYDALAPALRARVVQALIDMTYAPGMTA